MKSKRLKILLMTIAGGFLISCGDFNGDNREGEGFPVPFPEREILLTASIEYEPAIERTSGEYELPRSQVLRLPLELPVEVGNAGNGFASIRVGQRKFCYQGGALLPGQTSSLYLFRYEKLNPLSLCENEDGAEAVFPDQVGANAGEVVLLSIESPGCLFEANTCVYTEVQAFLEPAGSAPELKFY